MLLLFSDQLNILLNSPFAVEFFLEPCFKHERTAMNAIALEKLTSTAHKSTGGAAKRTSTAVHAAAGLFLIRDPQLAARLIRTLRMIFYSSDKSKRSQFEVLVVYLEQFGDHKFVVLVL